MWELKIIEKKCRGEKGRENLIFSGNAEETICNLTDLGFSCRSVECFCQMFIGLVEGKRKRMIPRCGG